jgi:aminopeptidase N
MARMARPSVVAAAMTLAVVALLLPAAAPTTSAASSVKLDATYNAFLRLDWATRAIYVGSTATIRNTSGGAIDRIEFNTVAARLGGIRLQPVTVDGAPVAATISDQTIVVPLGRSLANGEQTTVGIRFHATLRNSLTGSNWLFTKANGVMDLYRWLPWVSRRIAFNRPNHGDPFETPVSSLVRVRIATDRKLVLATTGNRVAVSANGLTQTFEARNVRDFTVTAATDYRTASRLVDGTRVRVYYRPGAPGAAMLNAAADAFHRLRGRLGPYPYSMFKVVESAGAYGMESPTLIWIPHGVGSANLRYLVAHETAHQWFYGLVGNDQASQPFADEAAADFAARSVLGLRRASRCSTSTLDRSIYQYTAACYYETIYIQGGNLLDHVRKRMGSTNFWTALRGYVTANRYKLVGTITLLDALDAATSLDLRATMFRSRFPRLIS